MFGYNAASENDLMSYFNSRLKTEVIVDASPVGLGGLLVQDSKVTQAEHSVTLRAYRYPQTEREMLGVV